VISNTIKARALRAPPSSPRHQPARIPATVPAGESLPPRPNTPALRRLRRHGAPTGATSSYSGPGAPSATSASYRRGGFPGPGSRAPSQAFHIGFAGAFRRSELVALNADDIEETAEGLRVTIRRSKTDQEGFGHVIAIPRGMIACPVAALKAWLEAAVITEGPVFRPVAKGGRLQATRLTDGSVADIVKAHAQRAGLDPELFAGHSLRSGFLTSAAARGASIFKMADQSRHKSMDTLRGYVRDAEIFKCHAGEGLL
jgi:Phage integrase family